MSGTVGEQSGQRAPRRWWARIAWIALAVALIAAFLRISLGVGTNSPPTDCSRFGDPTMYRVVQVAVPVVAFIALAYLALAERQPRWRIAAFIATLLLTLLALGIGTGLGYIYFSGCGSPAF